jgi:hypothetical protein
MELYDVILCFKSNIILQKRIYVAVTLLEEVEEESKLNFNHSVNLNIFLAYKGPVTEVHTILFSAL